MINTTTLVGRLTRDPELRYTPQDTAVATFTVAVNRRFKNAQGEREADFINCVIWRKNAENLANWAKKGALIGITGSIQTRFYENKEGKRVYVTEVVVDTFQLLESRTTRESNPHSLPEESTQRSSFEGKSQTTPDFGDPADAFGGAPMEISDDDLPF
ncbi:single-stranded DNA-binding protein [Lactococcus garvieae]|uniref:single-stranded DNA-binding protein n=1 Tax=Lactococcus garvieae TaxID=1363 RepID=UPI00385326E3